MTDPHLSDCPIYDELAAGHTDLLADCPPAGPIDPAREIPLFEDAALPTPDDGEERSGS